MPGWHVAPENDYRGMAEDPAAFPPTVSSVIPVYNRVELLRNTLAGLAAQDYPADLLEVIVADDGSEEDVAAIVAALLVAGGAAAQEQSIIVQSTTSTQNSGLFDHILPMFESKTGIKVNVVAVGTGQAIKNAQNGDGDVLLLVHGLASNAGFWRYNLPDLRAAGYRVVVVDLPGYGFARAPKSVRRQWQPMIRGYLEGREALRAVVWRPTVAMTLPASTLVR